MFAEIIPNRLVLDQSDCARYLKPGWDGCAAFMRFIQLATPPINRYSTTVECRSESTISPNHDLEDENYGKIDLYEALLQYAKVKSKLVTFLENIETEKIIVPAKVANNQVYVKSYFEHTRAVLLAILQKQFPFQHQATAP